MQDSFYRLEITFVNVQNTDEIGKYFRLKIRLTKN